MPARGPLRLKVGDKNVISVTVINKKTRASVDISGANGRIRFEVYSDPDNPTGTTLAALSRNVTTTPNAAKGQIDDGANGKGTLIIPAADIATANPDLEKAGSYFFAIKVIDTNNDPYTVFEGQCTFARETISTTP